MSSANVESSTNFSEPLGGSTNSCSSTQVKSCGMKTAFRPAASAGLISERGELPIIHVDPVSQEMTGSEFAICRFIFFSEDFDGREKLLEAGARKLVTLLFVITLRHKNQTMTLCQLAQGFFYFGQQFDLCDCYRFGERNDAVVFFGSDWLVAELLETIDERAPKAGKTVAILRNCGVLASVQVLADFFSGMDAVIQIGNEGGDGALEVNVVFPEGVVCVEEQGLG